MNVRSAGWVMKGCPWMGDMVDSFADILEGSSLEYRLVRRRSFITQTDIVKYRIEGTAENREVEAELGLEARFVRSS